MKESRNNLEMPRELPPDPDNLNDDRAHWAGVCIDSMADLTGCEQGQEALGDLLTNMFHWCDRNGLGRRDAEPVRPRASHVHRRNHAI